MVSLNRVLRELTVPEMLEQSARCFGPKPALLAFRDGGWTILSYADLHRYVKRLAAGLVRLGLQKGDRVAILSENRPEWGLVYLAIAASGGVVVPLDPLGKPPEHQHILRDSEARLLFVSGQFQSEAQQYPSFCESLERPISLDRLQPQLLLNWEAIHQGSDDSVSYSPPKGNDLLAIIYTSGTTGQAKGVMLSHRNVMSNVWGCCQTIPFDQRDVFLSVLPLSHTYECTAGLLAPLARGAQIAYARSLKSKEILEDLRTSETSVMLGVPLLFEKMLAGIWRAIEKQSVLKRNIIKASYRTVRFLKKLSGFNAGKIVFQALRQKAGLGSIRLFICGGAPLAPEIVEGFDLLGITFLQGYGLTETAPVLTVNPYAKQKYASVGVPIPGVELKIINPDAQGVGEIVARGESVMLGYYHNPEVTRQILRDGWLFTGDSGRVDQDGYYYITGRLKNVIVTRAGKKVYPEEVEQRLAKSPYILESLVYGQPVAQGVGEEVQALIVPNYDYFVQTVNEKNRVFTTEQIETVIRSEIMRVSADLADYKRIKHFQIRQEEFDKTATRKIKRYLFHQNVPLPVSGAEKSKRAQTSI